MPLTSMINVTILPVRYARFVKQAWLEKKSSTTKTFCSVPNMLSKPRPLSHYQNVRAARKALKASVSMSMVNSTILITTSAVCATRACLINLFMTWTVICIVKLTVLP
eukprot:Lithocolla_globosa_v1_NODE_6591_length_1062_cov_2.926514.p2 type:complete len:108 gc:universal NODE_6591_length_1062_cov_2.926514:79-402(+)